MALHTFVSIVKLRDFVFKGRAGNRGLAVYNGTDLGGVAQSLLTRTHTHTHSLYLSIRLTLQASRTSRATVPLDHSQLYSLVYGGGRGVPRARNLFSLSHLSLSRLYVYISLSLSRTQTPTP